MSRVLSRRFNFLAAVSVLFFLLVAVLWVRSFWRSEGAARISARGAVIGLYSNSGVLYLIHTGDRESIWRPGWHRQSGPTRGDLADLANHEFLGFSIRLNDP